MSPAEIMQLVIGAATLVGMTGGGLGMVFYGGRIYSKIETGLEALKAQVGLLFQRFEEHETAENEIQRQLRRSIQRIEAKLEIEDD